MNRRIVGVLAAVVLAALGTFVIVRYVQGADERALEGQETIEVLVVSETVPAGSAADDLASRVTTELVPAKVQAPGTVTSLEELDGQVAAVDLVPGEQLLATRFVTPEEYAGDVEFEVPEGLVEVTVSLSPDRAVGGNLRPGDLVGVFASFEPFELNGVEPSEAEVVDAESVGAVSAQTPKTPNSTHLIVHKVVVTGLQIEQAPAQQSFGDDTEGTTVSDIDLAPTGNLLVTLGLDPADAERLVFTAEFGTVWLAHESETSPESGTQIQTRNSVYADPAGGSQ